MSCPACSSPLIITAEYCTNCGADLTSQHVACPNGCGFTYNATFVRLNYCPKCGTKMPEAQE
jgi:hypothetical protein